MNEKGEDDIGHEERLDLLGQEILPRDGEVCTEARDDEKCLDEIPQEKGHLEVIKRVEEVVGDLDEGHRGPDQMVQDEQRDKYAFGNVNIRDTWHRTVVLSDWGQR